MRPQRRVLRHDPRGFIERRNIDENELPGSSVIQVLYQAEIDLLRLRNQSADVVSSIVVLDIIDPKEDCEEGIVAGPGSDVGGLAGILWLIESRDLVLEGGYANGCNVVRYRGSALSEVEGVSLGRVILERQVMDVIWTQRGSSVLLTGAGYRRVAYRIGLVRLRAIDVEPYCCIGVSTKAFI